ncbi:MAG: hypothetical protein HF308_17110 [Ignavibacteria bacterium]|jgi:hypothetical protein|nr:hypothetical protein [Ignavibacteria bacterium]
MGRKKTQASLENETAYYMYYNRLRDYALSMFEWTGLPDSVNERFLEVQMFHAGRILFFKDPTMDFLALPFTYGQLNVYNEPIDFTAFSVNYNRSYSIDNAVPIWGNFSRTSIEPIVREFAKRLYWVERALDLNVRQQKFPFLILAEESQRLTMMNAYEQWEGNEPFIFGNKSGFDKEAFQVLTTPVPYVADKLMEYKHNLWNEAMTFLGIGNAKQDKKERLVSDEVSANDEQITSSRYIMLKARQLACEKINQMFGLNISVDFKLNTEQPEEAETEEDDDNEN